MTDSVCLQTLYTCMCAQKISLYKNKLKTTNYYKYHTGI